MSLHTVVDGLPTGEIGAMVPVVLTPIGVRTVPNGLADAIAVDDTIGVDDVIVVDGLPTGDTGAMVPVVLTPIGGRMVPNGLAGVIVVDGVIAAEVDGIVPVAPIADMEVTGTAELQDTICGMGVAHVTYVPGVAGLEANGTGASVVSGVPGWVVAENGPGPVSGDVTITPGVDGIPMAVVPMVEICARLALQPSSRAAAVDSERRIAIASSERISLPAPCAPRLCYPRPGPPSD
jgi:hypothetical protein